MVVQAHLSETEHRTLRVYAAQHGRSLTAVVTQLIKLHLQQDQSVDICGAAPSGKQSRRAKSDQ